MSDDLDRLNQLAELYSEKAGELRDEVWDWILKHQRYIRVAREVHFQTDMGTYRSRRGASPRAKNDWIFEFAPNTKSPWTRMADWGIDVVQDFLASTSSCLGTIEQAIEKRLTDMGVEV